MKIFQRVHLTWRIFLNFLIERRMKFFQILYVVCIHVDLRCNVRSTICGTFKVGYLIKLDEPELYETKFILEKYVRSR